MYVLAVSNPFSPTGGALRAYQSLIAASKLGIRVDVFLPWGTFTDLVRIRREEYMPRLRSLLEHGVNVVGVNYLPSPLYRMHYTVLTLASTLAHNLGVKTRFITRENARPDIVIGYHEDYDTMETVLDLSSRYHSASGLFLQLPPFYSRERARRILQANSFFYKLLLGGAGYIALTTLTNTSLLAKWRENRRYLEKILKAGSCVLAVSRAVVADMGLDTDAISYLDPGVSLSQDDILLINKLRNSIREKSNWVIFGGRPTPAKGIAEGILVFSEIHKYHSNLKLLITGRVGSRLRARILELGRRLGVYDKIVFTGYTSREMRLRLVGKAMLMLYPSHEDAYPYAVLESLYLGTPVSGYDIPALRIYFSNYGGVKLAREGDLEELAVNSIELIESKAWREQVGPQVKPWDEVLSEEFNYWSKCVEKQGATGET